MAPRDQPGIAPPALEDPGVARPARLAPGQAARAQRDRLVEPAGVDQRVGGEQVDPDLVAVRSGSC
jgi:hypothetical protein